MKKDAFYFPHFSNARNDAKLVKLRRVMGIEGYGMYFLLLEVLREQTEFKLPISNIEDLAYEWHTSKEKLMAVVSNFELFTIIDDEFISIKLITYLQPYIEKSERARLAANKRWANANAYANALPEHSKSNASKGKETKVNESKVKESKVNKKRDVILPFNTDKFKNFWNLWMEYKSTEHKFKYKSEISEQAALKKLSTLASGNEDTAIKILEEAMSNGYKGFFQLNTKNNNNGTDEYAAMAERLINKYRTEAEQESSNA